MRLFIAIQLDEAAKEYLSSVQDQFRESTVRGSYTPEENLHLTLAFIGEYDDPGLVKSVVESIEIRPFDIRLTGIGAFGDLWWAGLDDCPPLMAVSRRLRRALSDAGVPFDRKKFSPHITLMRRADGRLSGIQEEEMASLFGASMTVDHISLMRSDRGRHGMIYTEL